MRVLYPMDLANRPTSVNALNSNRAGTGF
jgi:hypothetical protein